MSWPVLWCQLPQHFRRFQHPKAVNWTSLRAHRHEIKNIKTLLRFEFSPTSSLTGIRKCKEATVEIKLSYFSESYLNFWNLMFILVKGKDPRRLFLYLNQVQSSLVIKGTRSKIKFIVPVAQPQWIFIKFNHTEKWVAWDLPFKQALLHLNIDS